MQEFCRASTEPGDSQRGLKRSPGLAWELELEPEELPLPGRGCSFSTRSHRGRCSTLLPQKNDATGRSSIFEGHISTNQVPTCVVAGDSVDVQWSLTRRRSVGRPGCRSAMAEGTPGATALETEMSSLPEPGGNRWKGLQTVAGMFVCLIRCLQP